MARTPETAYHRSVLPLAVFLTLGGIVLLIVVCNPNIPVNSPFPFVESSVANRAIFIALSCLTIAFGIGLYLKSKIAWHLFLGYLMIGTILPIAALWDSQLQLTLFDAVAGALLNGSLFIGVYFLTAPVFKSR